MSFWLKVPPGMMVGFCIKSKIKKPVLWNSNLKVLHLGRVSFNKIIKSGRSKFEEDIKSPKLMLRSLLFSIVFLAGFASIPLYLAFSEDGKWYQYPLTLGKDACFSPDGKWIVFSRDGDICVIDLSGTYGKILTKKTERKNWSPFWGKSFSKSKG